MRAAKIRTTHRRNQRFLTFGAKKGSLNFKVPTISYSYPYITVLQDYNTEEGSIIITIVMTGKQMKEI